VEAPWQRETEAQRGGAPSLRRCGVWGATQTDQEEEEEETAPAPRPALEGEQANASAG
jgi:hypothetical protein